MLYQITLLTDDEFDMALNSGAIRPDMTRKDISALRTAKPRPTSSRGGSAPGRPGPKLPVPSDVDAFRRRFG